MNSSLIIGILSAQPIFLFLSSIFCFPGTLESAITDQSITSKDGTLQFRAYQENHLNIINRHRTTNNPQLKLSLRDGKIDKIETKNNASSTWTLELSDKSLVDLSVVERDNQTTEYYLVWHAIPESLFQQHEVCFHYGFNGAAWYNGYNSRRSKWPMETNHSVPDTYFNNLFGDYDQWVPTHGEFKRVLEHLFLNSDGFALLLDPFQPLFMRRIPTPDPLLCFYVQHKAPYHVTSIEPLDIKIHLFASLNARTTIDYVVHRSGLIPKLSALPVERMFSEPSWMQWSQENEKQDGVLNFTTILAQHGFGKGEIVLAPNVLETNFSFSKYLYQNPASMTQEMHKKAYQLGFALFLSALAHEIPVNVSTHVYWDFSNDQIANAFEGKLAQLRKETGVDSTILYDIGNHYGKHFTDDVLNRYPNNLITKYVESAVRSNLSVSSYLGFKTQHLPVFIQLWNHEQDLDEYFRSLIPNVLQLSIAGYSFITPNPVGTIEQEVNEEAYIRMVQAITFMPRMAFYEVPWKFSERCVSLTKKFIDLHSAHASTIFELAKRRLQNGSPIVRPLWYVAPDDPKTYSIGDQFMLGEDILVAPVLVEGQTERTVYLPSGVWIDQHGKSWTGPGEIKVTAPLEELPHFKRKI